MWRRFQRLVMVALLPALPLTSAALTRTVEAGGCRVTVFAPDWIWQGQTVNVFATVAGSPDGPRSVLLELAPPTGDAVSFALPIAPGVATNVPAGGHARLAVTGLTPRSNAPRGTYAFALAVHAGGAVLTVPYPLRVIRGSLVEAGVWSVLLPAAVALLWSGVLLVALPRFSTRGAWKRPSAVFGEEAEADAWFREAPAPGRPAPDAGREGKGRP